MKTDGRIVIFDRLCNLEQSQVMYGALQRAKKGVQVVTLQEEDPCPLKRPPGSCERDRRLGLS